MSIFNKQVLEKIEAEKSDEEQHAMLVLVVDDEVHTRHTLKDMLSQYYKVIIADDGQTALELINNHPAPEEIHLILCDQRMPKVNGVDFLEKTLEIIPDAVRIILTAYTDMEAVVDAINRAQIYKFIIKPFDKNELLLTIQRALETYDLKRKNKELIKQLQETNTILEQKVIHKTQYLNQEKDYSEMLFELAGMIMVVINMDQTVKRINRKGCEILGYAKSEIIGRNWFDHFVPENLRQEMKIVFNQIVSGQLVSGKSEALEFYENTILTNKGEERFILWHNTILRDENDQIIGTLSSGEDITERKLAEAKQRELEATNLRLQKAESLGQMAGGIAHLFNNYLHVASGNLEMALENLSDDSLIRQNLTETMKSVRRCSDVAGSMLHYLGHNFIQTESLDIAEFCRKKLPEFQSQSTVNSGITMEADLMDTELIVRVNAGQMQQVLNHLITNACESIGEDKGRISLVTKTIPASEDISKVHLLPVGYKPSVDTYACLEVTDTGCGISKEDIHKISDPFFTTKFTGRGLGLAVVSGIVKSWGGWIGVKSKVGHGSSFMVFLPLSVDYSIRQSKKVGQMLEQLKWCSTVLLVEDNDTVLKMTTNMLKKMGFEVISAVNGVEAVEKFRQHKESISCLITDLSMPKLDGWGTLTEIRKINPAIPAILASGYDEAFVMSSDTSEKPQAFLHKPYTMSDLKSALGQAGLLEFS